MTTNIRHLDLDLLLALDALYEERSVTRAADRLALTQPTVSGMLKRLRAVFGDELYIRTSHGVMPTPRAEALAKPVKEVIGAAQSLLAPQAFDPSTAVFDVKLCGTDYIHNTLLGPLAANILKAAPNATVSLIPHPPGDPDLPLMRGDIDILFWTSFTGPPTPDCVELYQDDLLCLSSYQSHRPGQAVPLADLCALSHVMLSAYGLANSQIINDLLRAQGLTRNIVLTVPNFAAVFQAMHQTELVAFLPRKMARLHGQPFKALNVTLDTPTTSVKARWHARMSRDARHSWIRQKMLETALRF